MQDENGKKSFKKIHRRFGNNEKQNKITDYMFYIVLWQSILVLLFLFITFAFGKKNTAWYRSIQREYQTKMQQENEKEKVKETYAKVQEKFKNRKRLWNGQGGVDASFYGKNASFSPIAVTGEFFVPVQFKRVSSSFGVRKNPITEKMGFHSGVDLASNMYSPIYAAFTGEVLKVGESKGRGKYIILKHGETMQTLYCHCDKIFVEEGVHIQGGEKIAQVGMTGQTTGPHLHFEVKLRDVSYNPAWLFIDNGILL